MTDKAFSSTKPATAKEVEMSLVTYQREQYYKIAHHDLMRPFFMSIVSDANHWMFISSNGGLTAGRKNAEFALFPYYTDDKIAEFADITGSKSIFQVTLGEACRIWEPFSDRFVEAYELERHLYKSIRGNKVMFEEVNHTLGLTFRYQWSSSKLYGFVRKASLENHAGEDRSIRLLDGIQNIMPYGVPSDLQRASSNLVDAYKRSELAQEAGLGIYALSAIIVDRAEPSEALKANVVWGMGLEAKAYLLSSLQLNSFRAGAAVASETDIKGEKGAYFQLADLYLTSGSSQSWTLVANVNQGHSQIIELCEALKQPEALVQKLEEDIDHGTERLVDFVASADGLQHTADALNDTRHYSNVLFNIMRGGIFDEDYQIRKQDFLEYLAKANQALSDKHKGLFEKLSADFSITDLRALIGKANDRDLSRLGIEYLPLKFSRRHGDPSRPWNTFSINIQNEHDGTEVLDYEGNWRDIFQNWEALAYAYPDFIQGMIFRFLNASTFDGYNPYRVTKDGFDWEVVEPDNPWSYIGYWGDHQIIYLQKFLEIIEKHQPGALAAYFDQPNFVYAAVPYLIKSYDQLLADPQDTIVFDEAWDEAIRKRREEMGADGALLHTADGDIYRVNFLEKILATVLAKLSNLIPETGIWMNTQRPEWNDANNALVGNGVSMVTLYYLRRFMYFFQDRLEQLGVDEVEISADLLDFYQAIEASLTKFKPLLAGSIGDADRKKIVDQLGQAASGYRTKIYEKGFSGKKKAIRIDSLRAFSRLSLLYMEHSIRANQRPDKLYHAYNLMAVEGDKITRAHLSEMLEGQVAVLSAGYLSSAEALEVLDALKRSALFRADQYSYILYPRKALPGFLEKNTLPADAAAASKLIAQLLADGNRQLVEKDLRGSLHFHGDFKNAQNVSQALDRLAKAGYATLVEKERRLILDIFEQVFNHKAFTGRSGTFYGYEGLGSIYWHMVSKLLLAVQECCVQAIESGAAAAVVGGLLEHYYEIEAGIGVHKSPKLYGAFPTDPYSHTPWHRGAQQPGMTGQVKEDILARMGELGAVIKQGCLSFHPCLLRKGEFLKEEATFQYVDAEGKKKELEMSKASLAFTYCQVPIIYQISDKAGMSVHFVDGQTRAFPATELDEATSQQIFQRAGTVHFIEVAVPRDTLKG